MITIKEIEDKIEELGLTNSESCIHSSIKSFGDQLEGGVKDGIKGLLNAFLTKNCTVMAPTFCYDYLQNPTKKFMPIRNGIDYDTYCEIPKDRSMVFHPGSKNITTGRMGILPKCILEHPDSKRGYHQMNSFTAVGKYAERLVAPQTPLDVYAPFQQLIEDNGYILLMGVELDRATIIHYAEQLAGRNLFVRWANDKDGNVMPIFRGGCSSGFNNFRSVLKEKKEVMVGNSRWQCYNAGYLVDACRKAITEAPEITYCGNPDCRLCKDAISGGPILEFE